MYLYYRIHLARTTDTAIMIRDEDIRMILLIIVTLLCMPHVFLSRFQGKNFDRF